MTTEEDPRLAEVADRLRRSGLTWTEVEADPALRARVLDAVSDEAVPDDVPPHRRPRLVRRLRPVLAAAAAAVVLALAGGLVGYALGSSSDDPVSGPPGTLGAVERVAFDRTPDGVAVDAAIVAHTWGTETVLDVDGLPEGTRYTVVLLGADGERLETGSFVAAPDVVDCRMNGAVLRQDVEALRVLDPAGQPVLVADLPDVRT